MDLVENCFHILRYDLPKSEDLYSSRRHFVFFPFVCLLVYLAGLGRNSRHCIWLTSVRHPQPKYELSKGQFQVIDFVCSIGSGLMVVGGNHSTRLKQLFSK